MNRPLRTLSRCLVCGCSEIRTDEVVDRGIVLLSECSRCDHRWTESAAGAATARAVVPARPDWSRRQPQPHAA